MKKAWIRKIWANCKAKPEGHILDVLICSEIRPSSLRYYLLCCCSWCMKINCDFTCSLLTSEPIGSVVVIKHNLIPNLRMRKAMAIPGHVHLATNLIGLYLTGSSVPKLDDTVNWWAKGQTRNIETSGLWTFDETPFMIDSQLPFWKRSVKHKTSYQQTRLWISHNHQVSNPVLFFFFEPD